MELNNAIQEQIRILPPELKSFLAEESWAPIIEQLSLENNLSPEQRTAFENEVMFVLIGFELNSNFKKNIQANLGVSESQAENISKKIDSYVFENVREFLPTSEEVEPTIEAPEVPQSPTLPPHAAPSKDIIVPRPATTPPPSPVIPKETHLATIPGEKAHEAVPKPSQPTFQPSRPSVDQIKTETEVKKTYPPGQDPYREPI